MYEYYCNITHRFPTDYQEVFSQSDSQTCVCVFMCVCSYAGGSRDLSAFPYAPKRANSGQSYRFQTLSTHTGTHEKTSIHTCRCTHTVARVRSMRYEVHAHTLRDLYPQLFTCMRPSLCKSASKRQRDTHINTVSKIWICDGKTTTELSGDFRSVCSVHHGNSLSVIQSFYVVFVHIEIVTRTTTASRCTTLCCTMTIN